jgi:hypothetical protein
MSTGRRVVDIADTLEAIARDLLRPRPSDQTPEESDRRLSARLLDLARQLQQEFDYDPFLDASDRDYVPGDRDAGEVWT